MEKWTIQYTNEATWDNDNEGFWEWWEVTDGEMSFRCDNKSDAIWLCGILNKQ